VIGEGSVWAKGSEEFNIQSALAIGKDGEATTGFETNFFINDTRAVLLGGGGVSPSFLVSSAFLERFLGSVDQELTTERLLKL
jgi:hypothetical protein